MDRPTVVVTGGAGFIGRWTAERLVADGMRVRVLDVREPLWGGEVEWVEGDVRDPDVVRGALVDADEVVHLASVVGVRAVLADPIGAIDVIVNGTATVLAAAAERSTSVVHVSSSEVLGLNPDVPWAEDAARVLGPATSDRWSYAAAKAASEHLVASSPCPTTTVRPFNVYGPHQQRTFVVPRMVAAAMSGRPIEIHGDGRQTRCFTYIHDFVDCVARVCAAPGKVPVLHVGSTDETSVKELAVEVALAVGVPLDVEHTGDDEKGDPNEGIMRRVPDVSLATSAFGWRATTSLSEGVGRVVAAARG